MISVAMATYNGEKYIINQLESILKQTIPADEVIICDDGSVDGTVNLITAYIEKNKLKRWKLFKNEERLGYVKNFIKAISLTKGEYIFLSDQDDIFYKNKFEVMIKYFKKNNNCILLNANYNVIDEYGLVRNNLRFKSRVKRSNEITKIEFDRWLYESSFPGFSMGFRAIIRDKLKDINIKSCYGHDQLIGLIALSESGNYEINDVLSGYRIHDGNTTGGNNVVHNYSLIKRIKLKEKELNEYELLQQLIFDNSLNNINNNLIEQRKNELKQRLFFLKNKKIFCLIKLLFTSKIYPAGTIIGDILYVLKDKIK